MPQKNDSLTIQIPRCDTHFGQLKEGKLMQLGYFFEEQQKVSFITKILAANELLSHVTITLRDAMV